MYRPSTEFTFKSNLRAQEMKKTNPDSMWCADHPTSFVGVDQWGNYYKTCVQGRKEEKDKCDLRKGDE
jgi:hypothetical protein